MIVREFYQRRSDGVNLFISYSDAGKKIHKVGTDEIYDEAIDVEDAPFQYEETDEPVEEEEVPDEEAIRILMGTDETGGEGE